MTDREDARAAAPSLSGALLPRSAAARLTLRIVTAATIASALATGWAATRARQRLEAETRLLETRAAARWQAEAGAERLARLFAAPPMTATLAALEQGLPADAALIRAECDAAGRVRVTLDTPDPDALRGSLAGFRMRAQDERETDGFRVTFERASDEPAGGG